MSTKCGEQDAELAMIIAAAPKPERQRRAFKWGGGDV
jgi:hypothetical protein